MFSANEINELLNELKTNPSESFESETIEFKCYESKKAFFNKSQEVIQELIAFANHIGGIVIIGVIDSSNVSNNDWPSQLSGIVEFDCLEVKARIRGNLNPMIPLEVSNHEFEGKNYLLIHVPEYKLGLVMTVGGKCYLRSGRDSNPMTPLEVANKIKRSNGYDLTSDILDVDISDVLDDAQIEEVMHEYKILNSFGESAVPQDHFLEKIGVTVDGQLTKGGLLFLGKTRYIKEYIGNIEYRFSKRLGGGALPINEVWAGSVWGAISRMRGLLDQVIKYDQFHYDDKKYTYPNICKQSFEEALINSMIHRDYSVEGMTTVELDETSISFMNPGEFYGGVTADNIFTHPPRHRNPVLASLMIAMGLAERAGMGTRRMNIEALRLGRSKPEIFTSNNYVTNRLELGTIREGVYVVSSPFEDYDVAELFLLNLLYGKGCEDITTVLIKISSVVMDPWRDVKRAMRRISCLSLVGNKHGIYITVNSSHRNLLKGHRRVRTYSTSNDYVSIYEYLKENTDATAREIYEAKELGSLNKTQRLLRESEYVVKLQDEFDVTWQLV